MSESAYLKDELGPVLAKGLAAVSVARPQDPVEYLGLWLLHYLQKKEAKAAELERAKVLEAEREVWAASRAVREKQATAVIQREWRSHVSALSEAQRREAELKEAFAAIEEVADEKFPEEAPAEGDKTPQEAQAEAERLTAAAAFGKSTLYIAEIDKSIVAQFKLLPGSNHSAVTTLRCVLYLMNVRPKQVDSWDKVRSLIKPYPVAVFMKQFQPCGANPLERKRKLTRVRRLLTTVHEDAVKEVGAALYAVYAWLQALTQYREARDEHIKAKRAAGKEAEEELDEEEEAEDEEKDADEEIVKAAELEAKRLAELEAAEEAAEGAEGEAAEEE